MRFYAATVVSFALAACLFGQSADFFVSVQGNDSWSGKLALPNNKKKDGPFASVAKAQEAVRNLVSNKPGHPVSVMLRGGTYYLPLSSTSPGTLNFTAADSGSTTVPITWKNYPNETPVISGGIPVGKNGLGLTWKKAGGALWQVQLPADRQPFGYFFYNGERRLRSRVQSPAGTGYYMQDGGCHSTVTKSVVDTGMCNLGTYLRITTPVSPDEAAGTGCPASDNTAGRKKCLDRFHYNPSDPITAWVNLNPMNTQWHQCVLPPAKTYPEGDIEVTIYNSWSIDLMRVSCVDTNTHTIFFTGKTFYTPTGLVSSFGPTPNHRYVVENTEDAFEAAAAAGQTGLWFLDRSASPWTLDYLANRGEDPNSATIVIAQVQSVRPQVASSSRPSICDMSRSRA